MKIKTIVLAGVIGLSAQASHAATDTRCNPFLFGDCSENGLSVAAAHSMAGQFFAALGEQRSLSASKSEKSVNSRGRGRFMKQFQANRASFLRSGGSVFDRERIELTESDDGGQIGGDVSVVPVPAAGFLLLAGLGGLAMVRRKKS